MRSRRQRSNDPPPAVAPTPGVAVPRSDPLHGYLLQVAGPVELEGLALGSTAVTEMRRSGALIVVPVIGAGELLATITLGPRRSGQEYAATDRRLLGRIASAIAPAIKVANLVDGQKAAAKERERIAHELEVAALIQQTLLPTELPTRPGWHVEAFYRPALEVGGDFYDFLAIDDDHLAFVIGDVTDKGVPAALVMATTRSHLRANIERLRSPGDVLAATNDQLVDEIPSGMFVTCLYGVLDTTSGEVTFANAGHNLPYLLQCGDVAELRATGMPLGLMAGMDYEVKRATLPPGSTLVLSSDGIAETHAPDGAMYGLARIEAAIAGAPGDGIVDHLLTDLERFAGADGEPDDDITLCTIRRAATVASAGAFSPPRVLDTFSVSSAIGNEREVMERVATVAADHVSASDLARLRTAVAEAAMNAIEHGNGADPDLPVEVEVRLDGDRFVVRVADRGGAAALPEPEVPDIEAKLNGHQSPRGWGLFLIEQMVDGVRTDVDGDRRIVELVIEQEDPT